MVWCQRVEEWGCECENVSHSSIYIFGGQGSTLQIDPAGIIEENLEQELYIRGECCWKLLQSYRSDGNTGVYV